MPVALQISQWFRSILLLTVLMVILGQVVQAQVQATARTEATIIASADMTDLSVSPDQSDGFILQNGKNLCFDVQIEGLAVNTDGSKSGLLAEPAFSLGQRRTSTNLVTRTQLLITCFKMDQSNVLPETIPYAISVNFN